MQATPYSITRMVAEESTHAIYQSIKFYLCVTCACTQPAYNEAYGTNRYREVLVKVKVRGVW